MESFNFGAFDTQLPGRIAAIPQEAQKQQTANMLQAIQMQGAMRQNEMSQMQLDELKTDRAEMVKLQANLASKGGSLDLRQYANVLARSPKHMKLGIELLQKLDDQDRYDKIMSGGAPPAAPTAAPAAAPMAPPPAEPGSFGADVMERKAADPFAPRTNMLPGAAAAPAGVNALAGGNEAVDAMRRKRAALQSIDTPQARAAIRSLDADIALAAKESPDIATMRALGYPNTQAGYAAFRATQRQPRLLTPDEEAQAMRLRPPAQPRPEAAPRTQQVTMSDGTLGIMNMDTGAITPSTLGGAPVKGKPSAFAEKTAIQRKQMGNDLEFAITQLGDITKDGGLIDQSTGSGAGRLTDISAGFFGKATPGAIAIGKIAPVADLALKMVPRFEGPQSNADTKSYKEAAGQLADASLPTEIRKEAGKVVLRIMRARKNQFATADTAAEGATGGGEAAPAVNIDALLNKYK